MAENKPSKVLKMFGIEIARWDKKTSDGKEYSTYSVQKTYKDRNGEWQHTTAFMASDLPVLATLLLLALNKQAKVIEPAKEPEPVNEVAAEDEQVPF